MINWYKEVNPSLGDLMYELDYLKIDLSVDDFKMIMDIKHQIKKNNIKTLERVFFYAQ